MADDLILSKNGKSHYNIPPRLCAVAVDILLEEFTKRLQVRSPDAIITIYDSQEFLLNVLTATLTTSTHEGFNLLVYGITQWFGHLATTVVLACAQRSPKGVKQVDISHFRTSLRWIDLGKLEKNIQHFLRWCCNDVTNLTAPVKADISKRIPLERIRRLKLEIPEDHFLIVWMREPAFTASDPTCRTVAKMQRQISNHGQVLINHNAVISTLQHDVNDTGTKQHELEDAFQMFKGAVLGRVCALEDENSKRELDHINLREQVSRLNESQVTKLVAEGDASMEHEDYNKAVDLFSKALEILPSNIQARHHRGIAFYKLDCFRQSINDLTKALDLCGNKAMQLVKDEINSTLCIAQKVRATEVQAENRRAETCKEKAYICWWERNFIQAVEFIKEYLNIVTDDNTAIFFLQHVKNLIANFDKYRSLDEHQRALFKKTSAYIKHEQKKAAEMMATDAEKATEKKKKEDNP